MKLCRYNDNRLGLIKGEHVLDMALVVDQIVPEARWPLPPGDALIRHLPDIVAEVERQSQTSFVQNISSVKLLSPVANPTKIIGAPANYRDHVDEAKADAGIHFGKEIKTIAEYGLFLKANSALVGPGEGVELHFTDRRNDHEVELAVIIGKEAKNVALDVALDYIAAYSIGLDMTVRGTEDRSMRKAIDTYAVLGPWMVTADEIADPDNLDFWIKVNGEERQNSNTKFLIYGVKQLIEYASKFYTLYPGDVIMTGTPKGVGPVVPGDVMTCWIEGIGAMDVKVR